MSDTTTDPAPSTDEQQAPPVTPEDMADRGVGRKVENLDPEKDADALAAVEAFKELQGRFKTAEDEAKALREERNAAILTLKDTHNIGFTSIAEICDVTSSAVLYLYERAHGKTAKQIREDSVRSAEAKRQFRETDPNRKPVRKQSPAEKEMRKRQREELKAFLEEERANAAAAGENTDETDAALADIDAEAAAEA